MKITVIIEDKFEQGIWYNVCPYVTLFTCLHLLNFISRHVQHCVLPAFLRNINVFVSYACFIGATHLGACCPDKYFDESTIEDEGVEFSTTTKRPSIIDDIIRPIKNIAKPHTPSRPDEPTRPERPYVPHGQPDMQPSKFTPLSVSLLAWMYESKVFACSDLGRKTF